MKKDTETRKLYRERVAIDRFRRKHRKKTPKNSHKKTSVILETSIPAPDIMDILEDKTRVKMLKFINKLDAKLYTGRSVVVLDFTHTKKIVSSGGLLFRASLCRMLANLPRLVYLKCKLSKNGRVNEVLQQIGVLEALKHHKKVAPKHNTVVNWRYAQGNNVDGKQYEEILGHYDGSIAESLGSGLYNGLVEAMTNTKHHAYPADDTANWWMFSQEMDNTLYVVFCDLGIGIPGSLPLKWPTLWKRLMKLNPKMSDGQIIESAIKFSKSRTKEDHRGKGLKQLTHILENQDNGTLFLFSNRGLYRLANKKTVVYNYKTSIKGTLIAWSTPLN